MINLMRMLSSLVKLTLIVIGLAVILSLEQVYGLPIIFLVVGLYLSLSQTLTVKYLILIAMGLMLAATYQIAFAVGVGLAWVLLWGYVTSERRLASVGLRLWLAAIIGGSIIGLVSGFHPSPGGFVSIGLSLVGSWIAIKLLLLRGSSQMPARLR